MTIRITQKRGYISRRLTLMLKPWWAQESMADFTASKSGTAHNNSVVFLVPFALPSQNATGTLGHNIGRTTRRNAAITALHISEPNFGCPKVFPLFSMIISSCDGDNASQSREKPCGFSLGVLLKQSSIELAICKLVRHGCRGPSPNRPLLFNKALDRAAS